MKKKDFFTTFLFIAAIVPIAAEEDADAVQNIRTLYEETLDRIRYGELYERKIMIQYPVIPAIGTPASHIVVYEDMIDLGEGDYDVKLVRIEHYYQFAGMVFYEDCLYNASGEPAMICARRGQGDASDPDYIEWRAASEYFFSAGRLIHATADGIAGEDYDGAFSEYYSGYYEHAEALRESVFSLRFPQPYEFSNPPPY